MGEPPAGMASGNPSSGASMNYMEKRKSGDAIPRERKKIKFYECRKGYRDLKQSSTHKFTPTTPIHFSKTGD